MVQQSRGRLEGVPAIAAVADGSPGRRRPRERGGGTHYQPALAQSLVVAAWLRATSKTPSRRRALIPEPSNSYDDNAVHVEVNGNTVGYLARDVAEEYQPVLMNLVQQGQLGWCSAPVMDGERGVVRHLATPCLTRLRGVRPLRSGSKSPGS